MTIAVLALQGAFAEHEKMIRSLGADCIELRQAEDLKKHYDGLILPGGESTVQGKLLRELGMFDTIKKQIEDGLPVLATCAGMILLASVIDGQIDGQPTCYFGTMPIHVRRNAYGRQLASFHTTSEVSGIGIVPMTFIRAPYVVEMDQDALQSGDGQILAVVNDRIVGVRYKNQFAFAFHPELDPNTRIHQAFLDCIKARTPD
jgi:5'-phosphate synthase pdxT subunit